MTQPKRVRTLLLAIAVLGVAGTAAAQVPVINSFTADPPAVSRGGESQISWQTTNATTVFLSIGGAQNQVNLSDSLRVPFQTTTVCTLTASNGSGSISSQLTVTVAGVPTIQFTAAPATIDAGGTVTLQWSTTEADTVTINNGVGAVAVAGTKEVKNLTATTTYTLTATGAGGSATKSVTVTVLAALVGGITVQPSLDPQRRNRESGLGVHGWNCRDDLRRQESRGDGRVGRQPRRQTDDHDHVHAESHARNRDRQFRRDAHRRRRTRSGRRLLRRRARFGERELTGHADVVVERWHSAAIDNSVGTVATTGQANVAPPTTTTYTLSVTGQGGTTTRTRTVVINSAPAPFVSTFAGNGAAGSSDGPGSVASFTRPFAVATMPGSGPPSVSGDDTTAADATDLLVLDSNHTIRKISPDGTTVTWAGQAGVKGKANGFRTAATFDFSNYIGAIVANSDGTVDIVDANGFQRRIDAGGNVTTPCTSCARYPLPAGLVRVPDKTMYIADAGTHTVTRVSPSGATTVIGKTGQPGFTDGAADQAQFDRPRGLTVDAGGNVYVLDTGNNAIRRISPQNTVGTMTVASSSRGTLILGCCASGIASAPGGGVYVTDPGSNTIKEVKPDGSIQTVAGSGASGATNGSGSAAAFNNPLGVTTSPSGAIVVTDTNNNTVRSVQTGRKSSRGRAVKH